MAEEKLKFEEDFLFSELTEVSSGTYPLDVTYPAHKRQEQTISALQKTPRPINWPSPRQQADEHIYANEAIAKTYYLDAYLDSSEDKLAFGYIINLDAKTRFGILQRLIDRLEKIQKIEYINSISKRIHQLIELRQEENPKEYPIIAGSLLSFIKLLEDHPEIKKPSLVVTPNKCLQAQWGKIRGNKVVVELLPSFGIKYYSAFIEHGKYKKMQRGSFVYSHESFWRIVNALKETQELIV